MPATSQYKPATLSAATILVYGCCLIGIALGALLFGFGGNKHRAIVDELWYLSSLSLAMSGLLFVFRQWLSGCAFWRIALITFSLILGLSTTLAIVSTIHP